MSGPTQKPQFAALTDIGLVRSENQDSHGVYDGWEDSRGLLVVVADGMGGEAGGATASQMAVEIVLEHYKENYPEQSNPTEGSVSPVAALLGESYRRAGEGIFSKAETDASLTGMGTTCTAMVVIGDKGYLAHIGDSRAYRIRGGGDEGDKGIAQLTVDQTWVQAMVDQGHITEAEAKVHPQRNVLTHALGSNRPPEPLIMWQILHPLAVTRDLA